MALVKKTCTRCGGSGNFSFNMIHGSKCYGCNGAGFQMVDAAKESKRNTAKAKREAKNLELQRRRMELAAVVCAELDADLGPFANSEKGAYDRVVACQRKYGKTPGDIVSERLSIEPLRVINPE